MADKLLTAVPAAAALDGTELYYTEQGGNSRYATGVQMLARALLRANNLSDIPNPATARTNLGVDTAIATAIAALVDTAPGTLDTLNELAAALGDDPNYAATITGLLANKQGLDADLTAIAALTTTAYGRAFLELANTAALLALLPIATAAQFQANTADKLLDTDGVWNAATGVALTDAATVALDLATGINFTLTIGGARTLGDPSNKKAGQVGCIEITQDASGSRTLGYHANWVFAGGTDPVLSTAIGAKDLLFYKVLANATSVFGNLVKAVA